MKPVHYNVLYRRGGITGLEFVGNDDGAYQLVAAVTEDAKKSLRCRHVLDE